MNQFIDDRWFGEHGIGRFAAEVNARLRLESARLSRKPTHPFDVFILTYWLLANRQSLLFSPGYNAPFAGFGRYAFVVHDLNHIDMPHNSGVLKRLYYQLILRRACRRAAVIMTVSHFTASRISEWSGVPIDRVAVVGNGVSANFHRDVIPHIDSSPYYFVVGNRKGHKNEARVVAAFVIASEHVGAQLFFTGEPSAELVAEINKNALNHRVKFLGRLDEARLACYYSGAIAVVFPSLYEGFGLPVVEAMACGTAVITSNTTSLPEVAGGAALLVDPFSVKEIATAMITISKDEPLRRELVIRGYAQAEQFTWDDVARRVEATLCGVAS